MWKYDLKRPSLRATEKPDGSILIRWPRPKSLGGGYNNLSAVGLRVRGSDGELDLDLQAATVRTLHYYHEELRDGTSPREVRDRDLRQGKGAGVMPEMFTIADGMTIYFDQKRGAFRRTDRTTSDFRMLEGFRDRIVSIVGSGTRWAVCDADTGMIDLVAGLIALKTEKDVGGFRSTERTVALFFNVAAWLRTKKLIPLDAALKPKRIKAAIRADFEAAGIDTTVERPRYTPAEVKQIFKQEHRADVRIRRALLIAPGVRPSALLRMTRRSIDLTAFDDWFGQITVPAHENKRAFPVVIGDLLMTHFNESWAKGGDLHQAEVMFQAGAVTDYPLFPNTRGSNKGKTIDARQLGKLWNQFCNSVGVAVIAGRKWYGLRRSVADGMESGEVRNRALGWAPGSTIGDEVYTSDEERGRSIEARKAVLSFRDQAKAGTVAEQSLRSKIMDALRDASDADLKAAAYALGVM